MAKPVVRLTVNLSEEAARVLEKMAKELGTTQTNALHQAIFTTDFLQDRVEKGATILLKDDDKVEEVQLATPPKS